MHDEVTIGARLRVLRKWRGLTQTELAGLAGLSQAFMSNVERGQGALDRRSHVAALASALKVSETDIVGGPHLSADPVQSQPHMLIPAIRNSLLTNSLTAPAADRARPLDELIAALAEIEDYDQNGEYVEVGTRLPAVLDELYVHASDPADEQAYQLALETLIDACRIAAYDTKDMGYADLAHIAATRGMEAAAILDEPVSRGKAEFARVLTMPRGEAWGRTLAAAERAADALEPHARDGIGLQVLGMLALSASLSATVVRDYGKAGHWLGQAEEFADRLPDDPARGWERFSKTNVGVWHVAIDVERGETGGVREYAENNIDLSKLADRPCRRASLYADVGRGLARDGKTRNEAVRWLRRAEESAPQMIRNNSTVRHAVEVLHGKALEAAVSVELRGMMARMGVPH